MSRQLKHGIWLAAALCSALVHAAHPEKPITLVVPLAAGGPADAMAGTLARTMGVRLGQQVIVDSIHLNHVPYKGAAPAVQDLVGGQVDLFIAEVPAVAHLIKAGKLRGLMLTDSKRLRGVPDVPTAAEVGLPKVLADGAYGLVAPPGLAQDIARKLIDAANDALRSPDVVDKFAEQGGIAQPGTPDTYRALLKSEQARWGPVIKAAAITAE